MKKVRSVILTIILPVLIAGCGVRSDESNFGNSANSPNFVKNVSQETRENSEKIVDELCCEDHRMVYITEDTKTVFEFDDEGKIVQYTVYRDCGNEQEAIRLNKEFEINDKLSNPEEIKHHTLGKYFVYEYSQEECSELDILTVKELFGSFEIAKRC